MKQLILKEGRDILIVHRGITESTRIFGVHRIEYVANHLFLRSKDNQLVAKVWLEKFPSTIQKAMKNVGMCVI